MCNNEEKLKANLWDAVVYLKISLLKNSSQLLHFQKFSEKSKDILEWKILELQLLISVTRFNNMQI